MTLSRDDVARAAGRAAFVASGCLPFGATDAAAFVEAHPEAPAEALYNYTVRRLDTSGGVMSWGAAGAPTRVACEVYRATFLALLKLVPPPPRPQRQKPRGHLAERIGERAPAFGERHVLRHRAASPPQAAREVSAPALPLATDETSPAPSSQEDEPARPAPSASSTSVPQTKGAKGTRRRGGK